MKVAQEYDELAPWFDHYFPGLPKHVLLSGDDYTLLDVVRHLAWVKAKLNSGNGGVST